MTNRRSNGERVCQNRSCRNLKMDKEKSTGRIAGAVATVMALDRAIRNEGSTDSVYNEHGIIVIFFSLVKNENEKKFHIAVQKNEKKFLKPLDF